MAVRPSPRLRTLVAVAAWMVLAAAWVVLAWSAFGPGHHGFRPPIRLDEVKHITYEHGAGGPPPYDHEFVDIFIESGWHQTDSGPKVATFSAIAGVRIARPVFRGPENVTSFRQSLTKEQVARLVALLNRARVWELPRQSGIGPDMASWGVKVDLWRQGPSGQGMSAWQFAAGVSGPDQAPGFSDLIAEFDGLIRQAQSKGK